MQEDLKMSEITKALNNFYSMATESEKADVVAHDEDCLAVTAGK